MCWVLFIFSLWSVFAVIVCWVLEALLAKCAPGWSQGHPTQSLFKVSCSLQIIIFISLKIVNIFSPGFVVLFPPPEVSHIYLLVLSECFCGSCSRCLPYCVLGHVRLCTWPLVVPEIFVEISWGLGRRYFLSERIFLCFCAKPRV